MKYCVVIIDGAAGLPLPEHDNRTCLELARTPNLDAMAQEGTLGLVRTVPEGMEPSSACACMSVLGYDPRVYYKGRAAIEARSMGIPVEDGEVVFRCNLVNTDGGIMRNYSSGHIKTEEAQELITSLNEKLGNDEVRFYPGVSYRHLLKLKGHEETIRATFTPPHDIPDQPVSGFLPGGTGSDLPRELMERSEDVLRDHPVNIDRISRNDKPATMIWLFWGSGKIPDMPPFRQVYNLNAAMTSGVDLLNGLARMIAMDTLDIPGVTDGLDNDYAAQAKGALKALGKYDLVVIHVEAPDEASHAGSIHDKIGAIQRVDEEIISQLRFWQEDELRVLILPDHPTPIQTRTHSGEPVPFMLRGPGFISNGAKRFTEAEAKKPDLFIDKGYNIMLRLIMGKNGNNKSQARNHMTEL